jgi:transcriptional regulator with XRE-family HTH domain
MPSHPRNLAPLDWDALVKETLRRRKAERLTQREHAALAGVSVPTIVAFDRGERTVSLGKAFAILRVVGLVADHGQEDPQQVFVQDAYNRWRELTAKLPPDSPARFPNGWYRFDYALEGDLKEPTLPELQKIIEKSAIRHTGWPLFVTLTSDEFAPREVDGTVECWIRPPATDTRITRALADPAHCDFWRAAPTGRFFLMRGYQEDSQEAVAPGTIIDITLPIWRLSEGLLHAARMAAALGKEGAPGITVRFRALYTGLTGRVPRSLQGRTYLLEATPAKSDEALLETIAPAPQIENALPDIVQPIVASLYERFGVAHIAPELVAAEIARFRSGRF